MTAEPMIEKLARVLIEAAHAEPSSIRGITAAELQWRFYYADDEAFDAREVVRAILAAMREPDDGMIEAGFRGQRSLTELGSIDVWQAMLDHLTAGEEGR